MEIEPASPKVIQQVKPTDASHEANPTATVKARVRFWQAELEHAHAINALVDNHRFSVLQMFLGFHGIIVGALVLHPNPASGPSSSPAWVPLALGTGVLTIGLALFGIFFSQHVYMRSYKHWIGSLELRIMDATGLVKADEAALSHKGSLYWDDNEPFVPAERTLVLTIFLFKFLNCGVSFLVTITSQGTFWQAIGLVFTGVLLHLFFIVGILRVRLQKPAFKVLAKLFESVQSAKDSA